MKHEKKESGEPVVLKKCDSCGKKPAAGISYVRNGGILIFICDSCGESQFMGYMESSKRLQIRDRERHEKVLRQKTRYMREKREKLKEDINREYPHLKASGLLWALWQ